MKRDADSLQDSREQARLREISKQLLGNRYRLELGALIARTEPGVFYARQLAAALAVPDNVVQGELKRFEAAGLLNRLEEFPAHRALYYQRLDSVFWDSCRRLVGEAASRKL